MSRIAGGGDGTGGADRAIDEVLGRLRANGGRITTTRRVLLETLFEADDHLSAEELSQRVKDKAPAVHVSTVYRNLDELEDLGVVAHTHLGHGPATYHLATHAHAHLLCEGCGTTFEAPPEMFEGLEEAARRRYGFTIDPRHFAVPGTCASCAAGTEGARSWGGPPERKGLSGN